MNSLSIGLIAFFAVIAASSGSMDLSHYLNFHSFLIVVVGTFAILLTATPFSVIKSVGKNIFSLFKKQSDIKTIKADLMKLAESRSSISTSTDPLIQYAISLWEKGLDSNTFQALISQYRDKLETNDEEAVAALHNIGKYPPALGMLGTVQGMISLFATLGSSNKAALGPSLAVAMTATFYGLLMAQAIFNPLADRISVENINRKKYYAVVYEIITLINRREPVSMIEEEITYREAA